MLRFAIRSILAIASLVFFIIFGVRSCANYEYPRPSEAFYVSDFADMLGPTLENFLIGESELLYERYKDVDDIGGMQIVFATFELEAEADLGTYNKIHLFNEWEIGSNGMGVLVALFFTPIDPIDEGYYSLTEIQIETGNTIAEYMASIRLSQMLEHTLEAHLPDDQPTYSYDYDLALGVASFMNELLNVAYGDIYQDPDNVVPQLEFEAWYEDYFDSYTGTTSFDTTDSMSLLSYFFSSMGSSVDKILFSTFLVAFSLASGVAIKGAGGFSAGAGLFRHRR
jgi:hypothetical protein